MVRLIPTAGHFIPGVPAVECEVDEATAARLLAYSPAAFVRADPPSPPEKAAPPTEAPDADPGPSDSTED